MAWGLERISSRELVEWEAYEAICGPVGDKRTDYHFARLMWLISNMMRSEDNRVPLDDFMPFQHADGPEILAVHPGVAAWEMMYADMHHDDTDGDDTEDDCDDE